MAEEKAMIYRKALAKELEVINAEYMRIIQKQLHVCSARCCENKGVTNQEFNICLDKCAGPLSDAHHYVTSQFQNYQERLERCVKHCSDDASDTLGSYPSEKQVVTASAKFEACAVQCTDTQMNALPDFIKKVHNVLKVKRESVKGE